MNEAACPSANELIESAEALLAARKLPEALQQFKSAQKYPADADRCSAGLWMINMLLGHFEEAWRESDAIRRRGAQDSHRFWQGEDIRGRRVMLRCLHGFGDTVQFLRFAPLLAASASSLIVEVPPKLLKLARCFDGVGQVITWGEQAPATCPEWDVQIEIMELPYVLRCNLEDLPFSTRYLRLPQESSSDLLQLEHATHGERVFQIGVMCTAGAWNAARSIPLQVIEPVLQQENCVFWNLQSGSDEASETTAISKGMRIDNSSLSSIDGLAALISRLDLVITVDTLAAHIAGALGVPAYVMLRYEADWRWMHERSDSPWYPSLRLFRQSEPGDWASVVEDVRAALLERVETISKPGIAA